MDESTLEDEAYGDRPEDWLPEGPVICECPDPVVEPIPLFNARQCGNCKRPFREDLVR